MRITIEPTHPPQGQLAQHKVVLDHPNDELRLEDALDLIAAALKAYGFPQESVDEAIPPR